MRREVLPDGSRDFGNGIVGPSLSDRQYFNSLSDGTSQHRSHRVRVSPLVTPVIALSLASCARADAPMTPLSSTGTEAKELLAIKAFLDLPFTPSSDMKIQQGYVFPGHDDHHGIDYIKGELDKPDTWQPFEVRAAADGEAAINPPKREGNTTIIRHTLPDGRKIYTLYGHEAKLADGIPPYESTEWKPIRRGEVIGTAGATGVKDEKGVEQPTWTHLYFQVMDDQGNTYDPYGIGGTRDDYPDTSFNGKPCGEKALFINCNNQESKPAAAIKPTEIYVSPTVAAAFTTGPANTPTPNIDSTPTSVPVPTTKPTPRPTEVIAAKSNPTSSPEKANAMQHFVYNGPDGSFEMDYSTSFWQKDPNFPAQFTSKKKDKSGLPLAQMNVVINPQLFISGPKPRDLKELETALDKPGGFGALSYTVLNKDHKKVVGFDALLYSVDVTGIPTQPVFRHAYMMDSKGRLIEFVVRADRSDTLEASNEFDTSFSSFHILDATPAPSQSTPKAENQTPNDWISQFPSPKFPYTVDYPPGWRYTSTAAGDEYGFIPSGYAEPSYFRVLGVPVTSENNWKTPKDLIQSRLISIRSLNPVQVEDTTLAVDGSNAVFDVYRANGTASSTTHVMSGFIGRGEQWTVFGQAPATDTQFSTTMKTVIKSIHFRK